MCIFKKIIDRLVHVQPTPLDPERPRILYRVPIMIKTRNKACVFFLNKNNLYFRVKSPYFRNYNNYQKLFAEFFEIKDELGSKGLLRSFRYYCQVVGLLFTRCGPNLGKRERSHGQHRLVKNIFQYV